MAATYLARPAQDQAKDQHKHHENESSHIVKGKPFCTQWVMLPHETGTALWVWPPRESFGLCVVFVHLRRTLGFKTVTPTVNTSTVV